MVNIITAMPIATPAIAILTVGREILLSFPFMPTTRFAMKKRTFNDFDLLILPVIKSLIENILYKLIIYLCNQIILNSGYALAAWKIGISGK